ncbi:MAG: hypothetical protein CL930_02835 [Deltaproteobacteria bacterium]|nr:hypothetical protein [Deltaproteobacteria bacterium]|tara:strand:- start:39 stop:992 length:954 start_codon:yes stop_codon:yes gene_type:complete
MMRPWIALFAVGCIQAAKLPGDHEDLQSQLKEASRDKWAQECAPIETARAITHAEFAQLEFQQGDARRATEHVSLAGENVEIALKKADSCRPKDRDKDAIFDHLDKCPDEPEDYDDHLDTDGCPDLDRDQDLVEDGSDLCPDEPEDRDEYQDEDGCPEPDNDADGILDVDDNCPNEAEVVNGYLDGDGCPDDGPSGVDITRDQIVISEKVLFDTGRASIKKVSHGILDAVVMVLTDYPKLTVRVEGHTDSQGSTQINQRLSQQRADSVRKYLVGKGVSEDRLNAKGLGEERPIDTNRTNAGRSNNRRVEFHITGGQD